MRGLELFIVRCPEREPRERRPGVPPYLEGERAGGLDQSSGPSQQAAWTRGTFKADRSQFWAVEQLTQGCLH